ncbi:MAG TPA: hypothetical protein VGA40_09695 [Candidatus Acidoferrales bacterium]
MHTVVVGGHSRNIGKTALVVDLIRALPELNWTAVKITQYGHGVCSVNGENCGCAPREHAFSVDEEQLRGTGTDTSRFLDAGARRAFWVRTKQGLLAEALPELRRVMTASDNVIVESNTLLRFLHPNVYVVVLDPRVADFKESLREVVDRADAFVLRHTETEAGTAWPGIAPRLVEGRPRFVQPLGAPLPEALPAWLRARLARNS